MFVDRYKMRAVPWDYRSADVDSVKAPDAGKGAKHPTGKGSVTKVSDNNVDERLATAILLGVDMTALADEGEGEAGND